MNPYRYRVSRRVYKQIPADEILKQKKSGLKFSLNLTKSGFFRANFYIMLDEFGLNITDYEQDVTVVAAERTYSMPLEKAWELHARIEKLMRADEPNLEMRVRKLAEELGGYELETIPTDEYGYQWINSYLGVDKPITHILLRHKKRGQEDNKPLTRRILDYLFKSNSREYKPNRFGPNKTMDISS